MAEDRILSDLSKKRAFIFILSKKRAFIFISEAKYRIRNFNM